MSQQKYGPLSRTDELEPAAEDPGTLTRMSSVATAVQANGRLRKRPTLQRVRSAEAGTFPEWDNLQPPEWFLEEHIAKQHRDIARTFTSVEEPGEAPDTQKMQRAIAEKLRQISDLEAKIASGHTPTPEQEEDLSKKAELEAQLAALGALLPQCSNKWAQMQCARDLSVSWESNKVYQAIDPRGLLYISTQYSLWLAVGVMPFAIKRLMHGDYSPLGRGVSSDVVVLLHAIGVSALFVGIAMMHRNLATVTQPRRSWLQHIAEMLSWVHQPRQDLGLTQKWRRCVCCAPRSCDCCAPLGAATARDDPIDLIADIWQKECEHQTSTSASSGASSSCDGRKSSCFCSRLCKNRSKSATASSGASGAVMKSEQPSSVQRLVQLADKFHHHWALILTEETRRQILRESGLYKHAKERGFESRDPRDELRLLKQVAEMDCETLFLFHWMAQADPRGGREATRKLIERIHGPERSPLFRRYTAATVIQAEFRARRARKAPNRAQSEKALSHAPNQHEKHPTDWNENDVVKWAKQCGIPGVVEVADKFEEHGVNGQCLLHFDRADLKDIGVSKIADLKVALSKIGQLSKIPKTLKMELQGLEDKKSKSVFAGKLGHPLFDLHNAERKPVDVLKKFLYTAQCQRQQPFHTLGSARKDDPGEECGALSRLRWSGAFKHGNGKAKYTCPSLTVFTQHAQAQVKLMYDVTTSVRYLLWFSFWGYMGLYWLPELIEHTIGDDDSISLWLVVLEWVAFVLALWISYIAVIVMAAWTLSLLLAVALVNDAIVDLRHSATEWQHHLRATDDAEYDAWSIRIQLPALELVHTTLPALSAWGGTMSVAFGCFWLCAFCTLPVATALMWSPNDDLWWLPRYYMIVTVVIVGALPLALVYAPASISTHIDGLLNMLNEAVVLQKDSKADGKCRTDLYKNLAIKRRQKLTGRPRNGLLPAGTLIENFSDAVLVCTCADAAQQLSRAARLTKYLDRLNNKRGPGDCTRPNTAHAPPDALKHSSYEYQLRSTFFQRPFIRRCSLLRATV
eukprot:COSAG03_NODE_1486_length_3996_cov_7.419040_3_plen_1027_part_00